MNTFTSVVTNATVRLPKAKFNDRQKQILNTLATLMESAVRNQDLFCPTVFELFVSSLTGSDASKNDYHPDTFRDFFNYLEVDRAQSQFLLRLVAQVSKTIIEKFPEVKPGHTERDVHSSITVSLAANLRNLP